MIKIIREALSRVIPKRFHPSFIAYQFIIKNTNKEVFSGPFNGMKLYDPKYVNIYTGYLLGTHELELHPLIEELCKKRFDTIINVGAEHGYYAVGLALRNLQAHIIAFETLDELRGSIRQTARLNKIEDRIDIRGFCDSALLADSIPANDKCWIIMDTEGDEKILLDPFMIPKLKRCSILVELHEFVFPDIAEVITERFADTHEITQVQGRPRTIDDFPIRLPNSLTNLLLKGYYLESITEWRPMQMRWFYLEPKTTNVIK